MNDERHNRILDACAALLLRYGYDKTTISDIAAEAGVSKGAIYLHFPSKEALLEALIWREIEQAQVDIMARLRDDPEGGSFASLYLHGLRVANDRPLLRAFYGNRKRVLGDALRVLAPKFANPQIRQTAVDLVAHYQALGLVRADVDPKSVAFLLSAVRYGLMTIDEAIPVEEFPEMESVLGLLAEILDRGLGTDGGDKASGRDKYGTYVSDVIEMGKSGVDKPEGENE